MESKNVAVAREDIFIAIRGGEDNVGGSKIDLSCSRLESPSPKFKLGTNRGKREKAVTFWS